VIAKAAPLQEPHPYIYKINLIDFINFTPLVHHARKAQPSDMFTSLTYNNYQVRMLTNLQKISLL
jgi:hypothetical protein